MELIQALERLSLEVRSQKISGGRLQSPANHQYQGNKPNYNATAPPRCPSAASQRQLDDFDNSIKTLFAQISDLDQPHQQTAPTIYHCQQHSSSSQLSSEDNTRRGSLETSSEEYSDDASQRSDSKRSSSMITSCGGRQDHDDPIVRYLLTRDLASITDTVKKIGRILAIGSEIERIYQILIGNESRVYNPDGCQTSHVDGRYTQSLCDEFAHLCNSEPEITNLPTILRYNNIRLELLHQLNQLPINARADKIDKCNAFLTSAACISDAIDGDCAMEESDNDEDDIAALNAESKNLDDWTENKLYLSR